MKKEPVVNAFEIKSATLDLLALILRTHRLSELEQALTERFGAGQTAPSEAFMLDVEGLASPEKLDYAKLLPLLSRYGVHTVALRHPHSAMASIAQQHGLVYASKHQIPRIAQSVSEPVTKAAAGPANTMVVERPVRAGQQVYAKGGDLIVLAIVSAGAEVIADGNIHVYAPLRGRALAGARGNNTARIFVQHMEAELVSIAGVYRTIEQKLPDSLLGKPTQIYLENERLVMSALKI